MAIQRNLQLLALTLLLSASILIANGAKDVPHSSKQKPKPKPTHGKKIHLPLTETGVEHMFAPGKHVQPNSASSKATTKAPYSPKGISFHGGRTIDAGLNVYIIWYGYWTNSQQAVITNFINSMDPSNANLPNSVRNWWAVSGVFYDASGNLLSKSVTLKGQVYDSYSYGSSLTQDNITNIAYNPMANNKLPFDTKGNYLVLTSSDVSVAGFCSKFCGYHSGFYLSDPSVTYKYSFIGDAGTQCPGACTPRQNLNGDIGVDGMINVIAHEVIEASTDPEGNAWFSSSGDEAGDLCNFQFGSTYSTGNGQKYNLVGKNNVKYLVQQIFDPLTGKCTLQNTTATTTCS